MAMSRTFRVASVPLVAAIAVAGAGAGRQATPGVTSSSILLGGTAPLTGEASAGAGVAKGADAYFKYVNDHGGVFGRKITYKYLDDGYEPQRTFLAARQLVQQDGVFALFNTLGTNNNVAIRSFLNQEGVPQLFVASGATTFGRDAKQYPWTIGYIPTYRAEGEVNARYGLKPKPKPKTASLPRDEETGKDWVSAPRPGPGRKPGLTASK